MFEIGNVILTSEQRTESRKEKVKWHTSNNGPDFREKTGESL